MSFAVASLLARAPIDILNTAEVATSFPNFLDVATDVGLRVGPGGDAAVTGPVVPVVTIDGPSGSGKGTISRGLAARLGWHLLDSGALYRLVALAAAKQGAPETPRELAAVAASMDVRFGALAAARAGVPRRCRRDRGAAHGKRRRGRVARGRDTRGSERRCCSASAISRGRRASSRTAATWAPWFSPGPRSRCS